MQENTWDFGGLDEAKVRMEMKRLFRESVSEEGKKGVWIWMLKAK